MSPIGKYLCTSLLHANISCDQSLQCSNVPVRHGDKLPHLATVSLFGTVLSTSHHGRQTKPLETNQRACCKALILEDHKIYQGAFRLVRYDMRWIRSDWDYCAALLHLSSLDPNYFGPERDMHIFLGLIHEDQSH